MGVGVVATDVATNMVLYMRFRAGVSCGPISSLGLLMETSWERTPMVWRSQTSPCKHMFSSSSENRASRPESRLARKNQRRLTQTSINLLQPHGGKKRKTRSSQPRHCPDIVGAMSGLGAVFRPSHATAPT